MVHPLVGSVLTKHLVQVPETETDKRAQEFDAEQRKNGRQRRKG